MNWPQTSEKAICLLPSVFSTATSMTPSFPDTLPCLLPSVFLSHNLSLSLCSGEICVLNEMNIYLQRGKETHAKKRIRT
jgi:hypothetical protein